MTQQLITGGNGIDGQSNRQARNMINENFTELYNRGMNVLDKGLVGNGITNDAVLFNTLITSIGSTITDLYFPKGTYLISTNVVLPSNIRLIMGYGAVLKVSNGVSITGTQSKIEAGLYQIFDLSLGGTLAGTWNIKEAYPQWLGASILSSDNRKSVEDTFKYFSTITIPTGNYLVDAVTKIRVPSNRNIRFENDAILQVITNSAENYRVLDLFACSNVNIYNPQIVGDKLTHTGALNGGHGIVFQQSKM